MTQPVAVLVDGDNLNAKHATAILSVAAKHGTPTVIRAYLDAQRNDAWHDAAGFRLIHAGTGKNAADILLALDAMELFLRGGINTFVIASSDGDFAHLAQRLREHQAKVIAIGEAKAPASFRASGTQFVEIGPRPPMQVVKDTQNSSGDLDTKIRAMIAAHSSGGKGMRIMDLAREMHRQHGIKISSYPEKTWRAYLLARPALFELDPRGPEAMARFLPQGFAAVA